MERKTKTLQGKNEKELIKSAEKYAKSNGIKLNDNPVLVNGLMKGMLMKKQKEGELYCPCRMLTGDKDKDSEIICPCVYCRGEIELQSHCHCRLFVAG